MATPSSSATSPSPPMAFLTHVPAASQSPRSTNSDASDKDPKKKAVQKFLARAELSSVTRALRARLSYASYKATNNSPHASLRDLEAQSQAQSLSSPSSRTNAAKRKAPGSNNYYNNPATQGSGAMGFSASPARRGPMAPPSSSTPRSHYPTNNGGAGASSSTSGDPSSSSRSAGPTQTLFTSILAPPSSKQARTIHNANDPPVAAPIRPAPSPKVARSIAESTRAHAKTRVPGKAPGTPDKRSKGKRAATSKRKLSRTDTEPNLDADGDVDMKAAETLTSLLLHHRPSIAGSASSPRSSVDSETGSTQSYSQFAQSSARTLGPPHPSHASSSIASSSTMTAESFRNQTPPPGSQTHSQHTTPRPAPTDNEAADLMLFLATSPSPARNSNKEDRDLAAYRALGGGSGALRAKGRVLFPTSEPRPETGSVSHRQAGAPLVRSGEGSFASSMSSIDMGSRPSSRPDGNMSKSSSMSIPAAAQLLPPPQLPLPTSAPSSPSGYRKIQGASPRAGSNHGGGGVDFNFNDFINASPSPARGSIGHVSKANLGLRADVGRKLFEEEQMRLGMSFDGQGSPGKRPDERGLGAGIDLVKS